MEWNSQQLLNLNKVGIGDWDHIIALQYRRLIALAHRLSVPNKQTSMQTELESFGFSSCALCFDGDPIGSHQIFSPRRCIWVNH